MTKTFDTSQDWVGCLGKIRELIDSEPTAIIKEEEEGADELV
jgi:hypothetical protein